MTTINKHQDYKFFTEERNPQQIQITNRLTRLLTQSNLKRVNQSKAHYNPLKTMRKEDFLYVCLTGVPPFQNEFQVLRLPGQTIEYHFEEKLMPGDNWKAISFGQEAKKIQAMIQAASKTKPIVFVTHSLGGLFQTTYLNNYCPERIIGIVEIGGMPIRAYNLAKQIVQYLQITPVEHVISSIDTIHEEYKLGISNKSNFPFIPMQGLDKGGLLACLMLFVNQQPFSDMFQRIRTWPNVLKCFIYGRLDNIIFQSPLSQKAAYYCYQNPFEEHYAARLRQTWHRVYKNASDNIQEKFVYNLEKAGHSLHIQKKLGPTIHRIVDQYLSFLEDATSIDSSKL